MELDYVKTVVSRMLVVLAAAVVGVVVVVACQFQVTYLKCKSTLQFEVIKFLPLKLSLCFISCLLSNRNK
jgi:hypothetical protein